MPRQRPTPNLELAIAKRRKHYMRKRAYAQAFDDAGEEVLAADLRSCQETELLICCDSCRHAWWVLNKCRKRVCPLCSYEISQQRAMYLLAMTRHMEHPKLVTLTMPLWTSKPQDGIKLLRDHFARLRKTKLFAKVRGGAYTIELKQKENGWHIHMHILLDAPFIPYQRLFSEWRTIIKHQSPQVDVRSASDKKARVYAAKYASKSAGFDTHPESIVPWYLATKGVRLFGTFGEWYNAKIEELDPDSPLIRPEPKCPECGKVQTIFRARDGPFIYGHEIWRDIESIYLEEGNWERPIAGIEEILSSVTIAKEIIEAAKPQEEPPCPPTTTQTP